MTPIEAIPDKSIDGPSTGIRWTVELAGTSSKAPLLMPGAAVLRGEGHRNRLLDTLEKEFRQPKFPSRDHAFVDCHKLCIVRLPLTGEVSHIILQWFDKDYVPLEPVAGGVDLDRREGIFPSIAICWGVVPYPR